MQRGLVAAVCTCLLVACALEDVWTGSACDRDGICLGRDAALGSVREDAATRLDAEVQRPGCPTGRFAIDVTASYRPSPSGVCFLIGPSETINASGTWNMMLESQRAGAHTADVRGCIRVPGQGEDAGTSDIDWRATVSGKMNCDTGELEGEIRATYKVVSVCTLGQIPTRYYARGPLGARYDAQADRFVDGTMIMVEPPVILGDPPGGSGVWSGGRNEGEYDQNVEPVHCLGGVIFPDDKFDAGVGDAGLGDAGLDDAGPIDASSDPDASAP